MIDSKRMILRRPRASERRPLIAAPMAPPKTREDATRLSEKGVRPKSSLMKGSAPLMTPVSYPNSKPPKVEIVVMICILRLWLVGEESVVEGSAFAGEARDDGVFIIDFSLHVKP